MIRNVIFVIILAIVPIAFVYPNSEVGHIILGKEKVCLSFSRASRKA